VVENIRSDTVSGIASRYSRQARLCLALLLAAQAAAAQLPNSPDFVFRAATGEKFARLYPGVSWSGGIIPWYYNPAAQPAQYSTSAAISALGAAAAKWSAVCAVTFKYMGTTSAAPGTNDGTNVVGWKSIDGYAGLTFTNYSGSYFVDGDIQLDPADLGDPATFDGVVTHEWGHMLGLAHSNMQDSVMAGPPNTQYNGPSFQRTLQPDDINGCTCLYGAPDGSRPPLLTATPQLVSFGGQPVGTASAPQAVTVSNLCGTPVNIASVTLGGNNPENFSHADSCYGGMSLSGGQSCGLSVTFAPVANTAVSAKLTIASDSQTGPLTIALSGNGTGFAQPAASSTAPVTEFYNTALNHYFSTLYADEAQGIDNGSAGPGWVRTGIDYRAWPTSDAPASAVPVCRFYGTPGIGPNSHFYTAIPEECDAVQKDPGWKLETRTAYYVVPASGSSCPGSTIPVYRLYNDRAQYNDSNHRFTPNLSEYNALISRGWKGEGVAWCGQG
jgi:hypothetical protein